MCKCANVQSKKIRIVYKVKEKGRGLDCILICFSSFGAKSSASAVNTLEAEIF